MTLISALDDPHGFNPLLMSLNEKIILSNRIEQDADSFAQRAEMYYSVGPTVIYSFMQVAGLTNDHLSNCFRFMECMATAVAEEEDGLRWPEWMSAVDRRWLKE